MGDGGHSSTAYLDAVAAGKREEVEKWLESKERRNLLEARDNANRGCVHEAAKNGHVDLIRLLHYHGGCPVEELDRFGRTPLHYACEYGQVPAVEALLDLGCKAGTADKTGRNALHLAACSTEPRIVALLVRRQPALIGRGDRHARTPLFYAVLNVHGMVSKQIAEELLRQLADPNVRDSYGMVALHYAAEDKMQSSVELLLRYNADANVQDGVNGQTPFELAKSENIRKKLRNAMDSRGASGGDAATRSSERLDVVDAAGGDAEAAAGGPRHHRSPSAGSRHRQLSSGPPRSPEAMPLRTVPAALHASSFQDLQARFVRIMERVQAGGLDQMEHVKRPHLFTGSWMKDVSSHQQLLGNALKYVTGPEVCMRVFNLLRPPSRIPPLRGDEKDILSYYETEQQGARETWGGPNPYASTLSDPDDDRDFTYARRVELLRMIDGFKQQLATKESELDEVRRNAARLEARLVGALDQQSAEVLKAKALNSQRQAEENERELDNLRGHASLLKNEIDDYQRRLAAEVEKHKRTKDDHTSIQEKLRTEEHGRIKDNERHCELKEQIAGYTLVVDKHKDELSAANSARASALEELRVAQVTAKTKEDELRKQLEDRDQEMLELRAEKKACDEQLGVMKAQVAQLNLEKEQARRQVLEAQEKATAAEDNAKNANDTALNLARRNLPAITELLVPSNNSGK